MAAQRSVTQSDAQPVGLHMRGVRKRFRRRRALQDFDCDVPAGSCCAVVGANGAGKTTLFSVLGGFLARWEGEILVQLDSSRSMQLTAFRKAGGIVGVMPQDVVGDPEASIEQQLLFFGELAGYSPVQAAGEVERMLQATDLMDRRRNRIDELSHGMRVRFGIAQALIGKPELVLLDEPMNGLDPLHRNQVRELIRSLRGTTTLLISSHDLADLQGLCDHVIMVSEGRCIEHGPLKGVLQEVLGSRSHVRVMLSTPVDLAAFQGEFPDLAIEQGVAGEILIATQVTSARDNADAHFDIAALLSRITPWLQEKGSSVLECSTRHSLEQAYLQRVVKK